MNKIKIFKKVLSILIIVLLFVVGISQSIFVYAADNGIGTINETTSRTIVPGATYTYTESDNGSPQKNYVFEYNPKVANVEALAVYGQYAFGGDTLSTNIALAQSKNYTVIAGVNGSPFDTSNGTTVGTLISDGRIISANAGASSYDSFAIKDDGSMFISASNLTFKYTTSSGKEININTINKQKKTVNNNVYLYTNDYYSDTTSLAASTEVILTVTSGYAGIGKKLVCTVDEIKTNAKQTAIPKGKVALVGNSIAELGDIKVGEQVTFDFINNDKGNDWESVKQSICGFYEILKDGNYVNTSDPAVHPRTTIGFKEDGSIVLYVVDGRQPTFSVGLTDLACAQYMKSLGCVAAIRMDGGGSSTMGLRMPGDKTITTVNSPSDGQERNDADGLLIVLKEDYDQTIGNETLLHAYPNKVNVLENTVLDINVKATDERYNPKETPSYTMSVENGCGSITSDNKFQAKSGTGEGKIKITSGNANTYVDVKVTNKVDELYATVNNLALSPNETVNINVKAYYNDGLLICSNESFNWTCSPEVGVINNKGVFKATSNAGVSGKITISHGSASFDIMVTVGQLPKEITGFENDSCGSGSGQWRNNQVNGGTGSCSINDNLEYVRYGKKSLKIDFNLAGTTGTVGTQIWTGSLMQIEGTPTAIGMWVYATPSAKGAWIRIQYKESGSSGAKYADFGHIDWEGWKYLEASIDGTVKFPISVQYLIRIMAVTPEERIDGTIYVDQLRAVYGFSNDDFISPEISNITPSENGVTTLTTQTISFDITDSKSGINKDKTEFYLDGKKIDNILFKEISGGYNVSWTPSSLIPLNEGKHLIKVRIEDNYENFTTKEWELTVNSKAPSFMLEYNSEVEVEQENVITLNASSLLFKNVKFNLIYNSEEIEILEIIALNGLTVESTKIETDKLFYILTITNANYIDEAKAILQIKYKSLVEGTTKLEIEEDEFESSSIEGLKAGLGLSNITISSTKKAYDFSNFISLVEKVNSENVLESYADIKAALVEYNNIINLEITDENALSAKTKLEKAVSDFNKIVELIDQVDKQSSKLEELLGGR